MHKQIFFVFFSWNWRDQFQLFLSNVVVVVWIKFPNLTFLRRLQYPKTIFFTYRLHVQCWWQDTHVSTDNQWRPTSKCEHAITLLLYNLWHIQGNQSFPEVPDIFTYLQKWSNLSMGQFLKCLKVYLFLFFVCFIFTCSSTCCNWLWIFCYAFSDWFERLRKD